MFPSSYNIGLGHLIAWVRQAVSQISIVGQKNKAFRIVIQATNWVHSLFDRRQQVKDTLAAKLVFAGGNIAIGFIQDKIAQGFSRT